MLFMSESELRRFGSGDVSEQMVNVRAESIHAGFDACNRQVQFRVFQDAPAQVQTQVFDEMTLEFIAQHQQAAQLGPRASAQVKHRGRRSVMRRRG